ncbi:hypothetical protein F2Q68_00034997 [Brassica cretica]|uniref:Uncharacterized protein n=1 Tax=Brassica cretica TaxID=69181 RepID=A0A8S9HAU3_BRACR|nr:hypothetical protein F2Q68_00034997 [Brassica cretica]
MSLSLLKRFILVHDSRIVHPVHGRSALHLGWIHNIHYEVSENTFDVVYKIITLSVLGDKLPKGAPELMMTPQGVLRPELVKFRDDKCFALNIMTVEMNRNEQFP